MNGDTTNPPDMDSIMATALLAFSRHPNENIYNQNEAQENVQVTDLQPAIRDMKASLTSSPDLNLQYQLALQQAVVHAATSVAQNNFLCGTVPTHPAGGLETFHTNILMEQAKSAALLNGTFCLAPESFVSLSKMSPVTLGTQNLVPKGASSTEQTVRQKEIEEALRSKSQRGRKRANLNEIERLELTRTRNREHAKSTRIRKKQRYEELLEYETKFNDLEAKIELDNRRRCCIFSFLKIRQCMMQELARIPSTDLSHHHEMLMSLFDDIATVLYNDGINHKKSLSLVERLKAFDQSFLSTLKHRNNLSLSMTGNDWESINEVAISTNGTSYVEVDIMNTTGPKKRKVLYSYLLQITFASKISDKMKSIEVIPLQRSRGNEEVSQFRQNLDEQISHPSVISLDAERDALQRGQPLHTDDQKQMDSDEGMCPSMIF